MKKLLLYVLIVSTTLVVIAQKNPCNPQGLPYIKVPGDTTVTLQSGTTLTFNRCEFFDLRDCMEIIEINDSADLRREGLNMYDKEGNILVTCGMIKIDFNKCGKKCLDVPVKIRVKVRFPDCSGVTDEIPALYFNDGTGWEKPKNTPARLTGSANDRYLELETRCGVFINCDIPKKGRKIKFIAPKGNKIKELRLGINCPLYYYDEKPIEPQRKVKVKMLCTASERVMVQSVQISSSDNVTGTPSTKLSELKHGNRRVNCKEPKFFGKLFGWLSPSKGNFRKKYYLPD